MDCHCETAMGIGNRTGSSAVSRSVIQNASEESRSLIVAIPILNVATWSGNGAIPNQTWPSADFPL